MSSPTDPLGTAHRPTAGTGLSPGLALALGLLHGPAELLPISSSGHVTLLPWLAGHDLDGVEPELRKALEVALHAGTAVGLLIARRAELAHAVRSISPRRLAVLGLATLPPAVAGLVLERPIERHLGTPATIAAGLGAGALAMLAADRTRQRRGWADAAAGDGLWLGVAQACALIPGVSRNGATLIAARARGFARPDASRLSREVALPVIAGATALKSLRLARRGLPSGAAPALGVGAAASLGSTLAAARLVDVVDRGRSLAPFAGYRLGLAALAGVRLRTSVTR